MLKKLILLGINQLGYSIVKNRTPVVHHVHPGGYVEPVRVKQQRLPDDLEPEFSEIYQTVYPYTMLSVQRQYSVYSAARYVVERGIPGAVVECGVWRGGCLMICAQVLQRRTVAPRALYAYDTFAGMTRPDDRDFKKDQTALIIGSSAREEASPTGATRPGKMWKRT